MLEEEYPIQKQWEQQQQVFGLTAATLGATAATVATATAVGTAAVGVAGAAVSYEGSQQAASATRAGAASNAYVEKMTAIAQGQSAAYTDQLDYQSAIVKSTEAANNATILHNSARLTEEEGASQIQRLNLQDETNNSAMKASYGASGVTVDSGSPVQVAAHEAGIQQIAKMDASTSFNSKALDEDWQGTMQEYQGNLDKASAQQYQYAQSVAEWQQQAGIVGSQITQSNADNVAAAQEISGYGSAISQLGSAVNSSISDYQSLSRPALNANGTPRG